LKGHRFSKAKKRSDKKQEEGQGKNLRPIGEGAGAGEKTGGGVCDRSAMVMALARWGVESTEGCENKGYEIDKREG
jgi:hypothetical protein